LGTEGVSHVHWKVPTKVVNTIIYLTSTEKRSIDYAIQCNGHTEYVKINLKCHDSADHNSPVTADL
jgi:hypothetical protein